MVYPIIFVSVQVLRIQLACTLLLINHTKGNDVKIFVYKKMIRFDHLYFNKCKTNYIKEIYPNININTNESNTIGIVNPR